MVMHAAGTATLLSPRQQAVRVAMMRSVAPSSWRSFARHDEGVGLRPLGLIRCGTISYCAKRDAYETLMVLFYAAASGRQRSRSQFGARTRHVSRRTQKSYKQRNETSMRHSWPPAA